MVYSSVNCGWICPVQRTEKVSGLIKSASGVPVPYRPLLLSLVPLVLVPTRPGAPEKSVFCQTQFNRPVVVLAGRFRTKPPPELVALAGRDGAEMFTTNSLALLTAATVKEPWKLPFVGVKRTPEEKASSTGLPTDKPCEVSLTMTVPVIGLPVVRRVKV